MKFAFAGTSDFGAHVLLGLLERGQRPEIVVSQPDRPAGRMRRPLTPPVVQTAKGAGLPCLQAVDINVQDVSDTFAAADVKIVVVAAFGQLFKPPLLEAFPCINVHASLLPLYRGAAPIARALMTGEEETGISIMAMTPGLDEGPLSQQTRLSISLRDDAGTLSRSLALLGAASVNQILDGLDDGNVVWTPQTGTATYAPKLSPGDRVLDFSLPARAIHNHVRALSPEPGAELAVGDLQLKLLRTWPWSKGADGIPGAAQRVAGRPGQPAWADGRLFLGCGEDLVELLVLQPAGKRVMRAADFLRGYACRLQGAGLARTNKETDDGYSE